MNRNHSPVKTASCCLIVCISLFVLRLIRNRKYQSERWRNYISKEYAESAIAKMDPSPQLAYSDFVDAVCNLRLKIEDRPYFNSYALWLTMCMIMSESGETISNYVSSDERIALIYDLAVDILESDNNSFSVRCHFNMR